MTLPQLFHMMDEMGVSHLKLDSQLKTVIMLLHEINKRVSALERAPKNRNREIAQVARMMKMRSTIATLRAENVKLNQLLDREVGLEPDPKPKRNRTKSK